MNLPLPGNAYELHTLPNGLRVVVSELPEALSVSCAAFLSVGSRYEGDDLAGVSHFLEHMAFKGTEKRPTPEAIAVAIEGVGGYLNAFTGRESSVYFAKVPYPHFELAMDVLSDLLLHPLLQEEAFEKEKRVILEELHALLDMPEALVHIVSQQLFWGNHPLGREVTGTEESLSRLQIQDLRDYWRGNYGPDRCVLAVAGQVHVEEVLRAAERFFGAWEPVGDGSFLPAPSIPDGPRVRVVYKDTEQAQLSLLLPGLSRWHDDRYVLAILHAVLGEGMSSRLFLRIREELGLAYSVASLTDSYEDAGSLGLYAGVSPENALPALEALVREWVRLREEPITPAELNRARELYRGGMLLGLENSAAVAGWFGQQVLDGGQVTTLDEALCLLEAVDSEAVLRLARDLIQLSKVTLAVVGPFAGEEPFLEHLQALIQEAAPLG
jgi:predicted Zn-dependent peptidase